MRLIDADILKMDLPCDTQEDECITEAVCRIINKQPTLDYAPVIHAHWLKMSDSDGIYYCCSKCGENLPRVVVEQPTFDLPYGRIESIDCTTYCPNCGAKMDKTFDEEK